jgi:hypothetical protein
VFNESNIAFDSCTGQKTVLGGPFLHTSRNNSGVANSGSLYFYLDDSANPRYRSASAGGFLPTPAAPSDMIDGHPSLPLFAVVSATGNIYSIYIANLTQVLTHVELPNTAIFRPVGWFGSYYILLAEDYSDVVQHVLFSVSTGPPFANQTLARRPVDEYVLHMAAPLALPLKFLKCEINGLLLIWFIDGQAYLTNGTAEGTVSFMDAWLPPWRWNSDARLTCSNSQHSRAFIELFDANGVNAVFMTETDYPCIDDTQCTITGLGCNQTTHFCVFVAAPASVGSAPSAPVPAASPTMSAPQIAPPPPPLAPPRPPCPGTSPSPLFFCNPSTGSYELNVTSGIVNINGSLIVNGSSTISVGANVTLIVSQNFSVGCTSSLSLSGSIIVNGSASLCGSIVLGTIGSTLAPITVSQCLSIGQTSITVDSALVDTLIDQSNGNRVQPTLVSFNCTGATLSPSVLLTGQSAECRSITASPVIQQTSLSVLFVGNECDLSAGSSFPVIAVAVGASVAGLVVLVAVILLVIPKTRHAIFPFLKRRKASRITTQEELS